MAKTCAICGKSSGIYPLCVSCFKLRDAGEIEKCEKCGASMVLKIGPYGKYLECVECKERKKYVRSTGVKCPKCGEGEIIEKKSKAGKIFYGCNKYPDCSFALWDEPTGNNCPECGELLLKKITKNGEFEVCSNRTCNYKKSIEAQPNLNE